MLVIFVFYLQLKCQFDTLGIRKTEWLEILVLNDSTVSGAKQNFCEGIFVKILRTKELYRLYRYIQLSSTLSIFHVKVGNQ